MSKLRETFEANGGILRLAPNWVPRSFCIPGRRIKLHPDDYYALGGARGGIDERWFASTTPADNGPLTGKDEGVSKVVCSDGSQVTLIDAVEELRGKLIGERLWGKYRAWTIFSKFFDNLGPLPHHIHHREQHAKRNVTIFHLSSTITGDIFRTHFSDSNREPRGSRYANV